MPKKKLNKLSVSWTNWTLRTTQLNLVMFIFATFLSSSSVSGPYFPLRTAFLFTYGKMNISQYVLSPHHYCKYWNSEFVLLLLNIHSAPWRDKTIIQMWAESLLCPSHGNRRCDAKRFHQQTIIWNSTLFFPCYWGSTWRLCAGARVVPYRRLSPSSWGTTAAGLLGFINSQFYTWRRASSLRTLV